MAFPSQYPSPTPALLCSLGPADVLSLFHSLSSPRSAPFPMQVLTNCLSNQQLKLGHQITLFLWRIWFLTPFPAFSPSTGNDFPEPDTLIASVCKAFPHLLSHCQGCPWLLHNFQIAILPYLLLLDIVFTVAGMTFQKDEIFL